MSNPLNKQQLGQSQEYMLEVEYKQEKREPIMKNNNKIKNLFDF